MAHKNIFISYRRRDLRPGFIDKLVDALESDGFSVFFDRNDLNRQGQFPEYLREGVRNSDCFLPILSQSYLDFKDSDNEESWCLFESVTAIQSGLPIVPLLMMPDDAPSKYHRDRKPYSCAITDPERPSESDKEWIRYLLCTAQSAEATEDWYSTLRTLIFDSFCSSKQITLFSEYLSTNVDPDIIRLAGRDGSSVQDEALYVPLSARRHWTRSELSVRMANQQSTEPELIRPDALTENILQNRLAIITGEAGQGKTVFLKKLQTTLAEYAQAEGLNRNLPYPIYLECRDIAAALELDEASQLWLQSPESFSHCLAKAAEMPFFAFDCVKEKGSPLLLINGLDEVSEETAHEILSGLGTLKTCRMIFSSRPRGIAAHEIRIAHEEVRKYSLVPLDEAQIETFSDALFHFFAENDERESIRLLASDSENRTEYLELVRMRERTVPDYPQITRNPFYAYPLVTYYLHHRDLPENGIALLDYFTTYILDRDQERRMLSDEDICTDDVKLTLGILAMDAYLSTARGCTGAYGPNEIKSACNRASKLLELTPRSRRHLERYLARCPYFTRNRGFIHDAYAAYSAALCWWAEAQSGIPCESDLETLLRAGTTCEKAVEAILCYVDINTDPDDLFTVDLLEDLQHTTEPPGYDLLCQTVHSFVRHREVSEDRLLREMIRRGICGILSFDPECFSCADGSNPYDELFYFAVVYDYKNTLKRSRRIASVPNEAYVETVLLHDLHILFDLEPIEINRNHPLYPTMLSASSLERCEHTSARGHVTFSGFPHNRRISLSMLRDTTSMMITGSCPDIPDYILEFPCSALRYIKSDGVNYNYQCIGNCLIGPCGILLKGCRRSRIPRFDLVSRIGKQAFDGCSALADIQIPHSVILLGAYAFGSCSALTDLTIPSSVRTIGPACFQNCIGIRSISIPYSVSTIESAAFMGCSGLTSISLPSRLSELQYALFCFCSNLKTVELPSQLLKIGKFAFQGCTSLESLMLPAGIIRIKANAFLNCDRLKEITYRGTKSQWYQIDGCEQLSDRLIHCSDGDILPDTESCL